MNAAADFQGVHLPHLLPPPLFEDSESSERCQGLRRRKEYIRRKRKIPMQLAVPCTFLGVGEAWHVEENKGIAGTDAKNNLAKSKGKSKSSRVLPTREGIGDTVS